MKPQGTDVRCSNLTPYYHIYLFCITNFAINASHQRSQSTPSHCAMCRCVEYHLLRFHGFGNQSCNKLYRCQWNRKPNSLYRQTNLAWTFDILHTRTFDRCTACCEQFHDAVSIFTTSQNSFHELYNLDKEHCIMCRILLIAPHN